MPWSPYVGADAILLSTALFAIGCLLVLSGKMLKREIKLPSSKGILRALILAAWVLSFALLFVSREIIARVIRQLHLPQPPNTSILSGPIFPITFLSAIATLIAIAYLCRAYGLNSSLGNALVGTLAAPMIFEIPFLLIVISRVKISPFFMTLYFVPLFLCAIATTALLLLSPLPKLSNYTFYSMGAMFLIFAIWAFFGFSYPSNPTAFSMNGISKILSFTTAITLFLPAKHLKRTTPENARA